MKKVKYLLFVLLLFLTINVKAADRCEKTELNRLKDLAKKVEFDYSYKLDESGTAIFSINAVNLNEDLKVLIIEDYYNDKYQEFKDDGTTHQATIDNFQSGDKVTVTIKAYVPNWCSGKTVATKTVKLPYYNYFYDEEKCKGNEDFKYCKQLIDVNLSQKEFDKQFELYLKNKDKNQGSSETQKAEETNLIYIIATVVLVVIIIVVLTVYIIKRKKKNSL